MQDGGQTIIISAPNLFTTVKPVISVSFRQLPAAEITAYEDLHKSVSYIELIFRDNGIGFNQKHAKQIFTILKGSTARKLLKVQA